MKRPFYIKLSNCFFYNRAKFRLANVSKTHYNETFRNKRSVSIKHFAIKLICSLSICMLFRIADKMIPITIHGIN